MCRLMFVSLHLLLFVFLKILAVDILVTVKQGKLKGKREATVIDNRLYFAFYSVPYARPPIGNLRFKNPRPLKKWNGILDASLEYHGSCAQTHIVHKKGLYGSEDCLYLNIYTPNIPVSNDNILKPVIVWIHGYAFTSSFSHIHGADFIVTNDILLVTVTHRIGVFGFLKLNNDDSHANMGLKDIVLALKWIRTNIKQFGGDKDKVTLMGSGSGATLISLLMITKANKLFSKIILQSGGIFSPSIFQGNPLSERDKLENELKKKHLALTRASTNDIIQSSHDIFIRNSEEMINLQRPIIPFTPIIELNSKETLLSISPDQFYGNKEKKSNFFEKPILIGYNSQESISEAIPFIHNSSYLEKFIKSFKYFVPFSDGCKFKNTSRTYKEVSDIIKNKYFKDKNTERYLVNLLKYMTDLLKFPILKFVRSHVRVSQSNIYMYNFDYKGKLNAVKATSIADKQVKIDGAASGDEICYLLRCEPLWETYGRLIKKDNDKDIKFIKEITLLWSNFAKFGEPTPFDYDGNVTWPPTNHKFENVLLLRKNFHRITSTEDSAMFDFWRFIYDNYYREEICKRVHDEF